MEKEYSLEYFVSAGEADAEQELSLPVLTDKLIETATAHANSLGIGNPDMEDKNSGWVLSRLTIELMRAPRVNSHYRLTTWIEGWNRHFSQRCFMVSDSQGNPIGYARSIWMVLNTATRANAGLDKLQLPQDIISDRPCPIERQAKHQKIGKDGITPTHPGVQHRFKYCDLDSYRHVNTVRYVQLLLNQMPLERYDSHRLSRLELSFLHEAHYDMPVVIYRHDMPGQEPEELQSSFYIESQQSTPILYARTRFSKRI